MEYYEQVATLELADEFYRDLRHIIQKAAERPESFAIRERDIRRVNLRRFPCHFLFRINQPWNGRIGARVFRATPQPRRAGVRIASTCSLAH
jgi:hypothetical protein